MKPLVTEIIADTETPITLFAKLAGGNSPAFLFESAEKSAQSGRYSFMGFGSLVVVSLPQGKKDPLKILQSILKKYTFPKIKDLPKFQGGLVGYFGYDLIRYFEPISLPKKKHPLLKDIAEGKFFIPKNFLVFDHLQSKLFVISFEKNPTFINSLKEKLKKHVEFPSMYQNGSDVFPENKNFEADVTKAKEYIRSGECIQIVLSQKFSFETDKDDLTLYRNLRAGNPSPYMFLLRFDECSIIGSSPETLVRIEDGEITVRPIAGTRKRGKNLKEDKKLEMDLLSNVKEVAEHRMLVDLGRNDIGRVSKKGTVRVTKLLAVERFSHVMHLVSEIRGTIDSKKNMFDVFRACFPAGTLTGAPKIRAMQIISELEKERRGIYGGAVGYFDVSGNMDFAIAIRTIIKKGPSTLVQSGAGIVYDSIPEMEHEECIHKAKACIAVL